MKKPFVVKFTHPALLNGVVWFPPHPPLRVDLSHKGRGNAASTLITSPLVGEVVMRKARDG
ncbi:MAG: hypothetical protein BGO67_05690 [Alphaproteobacteria bacterium 41-28]|nr:MAG: hypothetical protein BGO67_05690 [Alphaproteobacteria bacterium 41-28]